MNRFFNRTRRAASIPRKLLADGKVYLLPLYYLLRTSDLAREGIEHSGSFRFADHIYEGRPGGRFGFGRALDAVLLRLKSARALRSRYVFAVEELRHLVHTAHEAGRPTRVLSVPCGLARELFELSAEIGADNSSASKVELHGLDLDAELIADLRERNRQEDACLTFHTGDALFANDYPGMFDVILSTGLTEFLSDEEVVRFFRIVRTRLNPDGRLITSGLRRHAPSDFLLRNIADLQTHYRSEADLRALAKTAGFRYVDTYHDRTRLQTMVIATKDCESGGTSRPQPS